MFAAYAKLIRRACSSSLLPGASGSVARLAVGTAGVGRWSRFFPSRGLASSRLDTSSGEGRRKNRIAVTSRDWNLDVAASQTGWMGLHPMSTSSPILYWAAMADAPSAGAVESMASITLRSASLTEMDWSPTRSRLPVKDMPASKPRQAARPEEKRAKPTACLFEIFSAGAYIDIIGRKSIPGA